MNPGSTSQGSGLGGRVATDDLNRPAVSFAASEEKTSAALEYEDVKLSNIRKVIAKTMHESLSQMAQLTLNTSFDATEILNVRKKFKANAEKMGLANITINDSLLYAVSRILPMHKT